MKGRPFHLHKYRNEKPRRWKEEKKGKEKIKEEGEGERWMRRCSHGWIAVHANSSGDKSAGVSASFSTSMPSSLLSLSLVSFFFFCCMSAANQQISPSLCFPFFFFIACLENITHSFFSKILSPLYQCGKYQPLRLIFSKSQSQWLIV